MAKIISLGCKAADIHHRYSAVHSSLFGAFSYRLVITALLGKTERSYGKYEQTLDGLWKELVGLDEQIAGTTAEERVSHGSDQLHQILIDYTHTLHDVIAHLQDICRKLREDEEEYRTLDAKGQSRFNRDKIAYDHSIIQLERLGTKLNKLFSTY